MLFEAIPENVPRAREALRDQLAPIGLTIRQLADISIAVTEAVANSVRHAYRNQPQAGAVRIEAAVDDDTITITVSDTGCGPLPNPDSDGLGMGIPLMTALTTTLQIEGQPDQGTTVRMTFRTRSSSSENDFARTDTRPSTTSEVR